MFRILLANKEEISRAPCSCNINATAFKNLQNMENGIPSTNLLLYFPCNDTSNLKDVINGITLTKSGSVSYRQSSWKESDFCIFLNGNNVTSPLSALYTKNANFTMPSIFTLMCMLKPVDSGYGNTPVVDIGSYDTNTGFGIWLKDNQLSCRVNQAYNYYGDTITSEWHHVAFVCDQQQAILYVDGEIYHTRSLTITPYTTTDINIGARYTVGNSLAVGYNGYLDDIRLYSYPMTQKEIIRIAKRYGVYGGEDV